MNKVILLGVALASVVACGDDSGSTGGGGGGSSSSSSVAASTSNSVSASSSNAGPGGAGGEGQGAAGGGGSTASGEGGSEAVAGCEAYVNARNSVAKRIACDAEVEDPSFCQVFTDPEVAECDAEYGALFYCIARGTTADSCECVTEKGGTVSSTVGVGGGGGFFGEGGFGQGGFGEATYLECDPEGCDAEGEALNRCFGGGEGGFGQGGFGQGGSSVDSVAIATGSAGNGGFGGF